MPAPPHASRIHGCLLGGALGDAHSSQPASRPGPLRFSAGTQLTLYTVDGLLEALEWANDGVAADTNACLWLAYLRWLGTQGEAVPASAPVQPPRWIDSHEALRQRRDPAGACLTGLGGGEMGTVYRPVNPDADDPGALTRSAPFGLIPHIEQGAVYQLSADAAALTHGHAAARQAAGMLSLIILALSSGRGISEAAAAALEYVRGGNLARGEVPESDLVQRLELAIRRASDHRAAGQPAAGQPGAGHPGAGHGTADGSGAARPEGSPGVPGDRQSAAEVLAAAVYAALVTAPLPGDTGAGMAGAAPDGHFRLAVALAADLGRGSDAAASVAGNILGAFYGEGCLPAEWLSELESADLIRGMGARLAALTGA